jgi:hypothetical protein
MSQNRDSALQRIKIGVTGLVVVLLFVSLANMVNERVTDNESAAATATVQTGAEEKLPDEPLAELGLAPVNGPKQKAKAKAAKANAAATNSALETPNIKLQAETPGQQ